MTDIPDFGKTFGKLWSIVECDVQLTFFFLYTTYDLQHATMFEIAIHVCTIHTRCSILEKVAMTMAAAEAAARPKKRRNPPPEVSPRELS